MCVPIYKDEEVVELSRAQVRSAYRVLHDDEQSRWYLYVVEKQSDTEFKVLPIENPVQVAGKWILRGASWRMIAVDPQTITHTDIDSA